MESGLQDHMYACILNGQDDDGDGDDQDSDNEESGFNLESRKMLLPDVQPSSKMFDYPSLLRRKTMTDLCDDDLFTDILKEMNER